MKALCIAGMLVGVPTLCYLLTVGSQSSPAAVDGDTAAGQVERKPEKRAFVSLVDLIAQKDAFHNRAVAASGFLVLEDEYCGLFLSREDARYGITKNGVWVGFSSNLLASMDVRSFGEQYVFVSGTFDKQEQGHMGAWSGKIGNIDTIRRLKRR
jgi:hypothetical protein